MTEYYRAQGGVIVELFTLPAGFTLAQCFVAAIAAAFLAVPDGVSPSVGWVVNADGSLSAPVAAAPTEADLIAYANAKQWALATGGYTITMTPVGGTATALVWATDEVSQGMITGKAVRLMQPGAPSTVDWQFASGFVTIATADFIAAAIQIADFVQATFTALQPILAAITAPTTTTTAAIDAASWPSNVSTTPA